ncbi:DUF5071 domain-containing protein [Gynuella sunshinyii]|uniref:DUF5071 domain-containing protein n=1 Tax=Gynuella sunshinyii YC6258 TaxID=1445510 RepID=A0A0C5VWI5_9GAMM|nr:DUF5071 domain-containing protein [Gynuella sunshinyii]AJQ94764.1 hypothetical Protein YC6258_02726 [Gynuella sunshinyii YC6258]
MRIIPNSKSDDEACENLSRVTDAEIIPYIYELLEWLQDINWPVAQHVAERLSKLGLELVEPILVVLNGTDEVWKYWIVSHLLYMVNDQVYQSLELKLRRMKSQPTQSEIKEEVYEAVCELLYTQKQV